MGFGCVLGSLLGKVVGWLTKVTPSDLEMAKQLVYDCLVNLKEFTDIVKIGLEQGLSRALYLLENSKDPIVAFCANHPTLMSNFLKLHFKIVPREILIRYGVKKAVKYGSARASSQVVKSVVKVTNPAGIVADVAQAGLEIAGYEEAGKTVGALGNVGTGLVAGAVVGGPIGAFVGAFAGLITWGAGEVVGGAVNKAMS